MSNREILLQWLHEPGDGLYIDTLDKLVEEMLDEQRNQCAMAAYRICGDDDVAQACLSAVEKEDE